MTLRDSDGVVIFSAYHNLVNCNDALEAEISAVMEGLSLAHQWSVGPIILQSDCANILADVKENKRNYSVYGYMVEEVKHLISLHEVKLIKITQDQNRVAHSLANLGRTGGGTACLVHQFPDVIAQLLLADCNPMFME
jgi:hypothetical protein